MEFFVRSLAGTYKVSLTTDKVHFIRFFVSGLDFLSYMI